MARARRSRSRRRSRTAGSSDAQRQWLDLLEELGEVERCVSLAWGAGRAVAIPEEELNEALRRALVVRAVGGSPQREVTLDEEAVLRLADELDSPERRAALTRELETLRGAMGAGGAAAVARLLTDDAYAWLCFAAGCLAAEVA
jgi:hypothetical protein